MPGRGGEEWERFVSLEGMTRNLDTRKLALNRDSMFIFPVTCSQGTFYSGERDQCIPCSPGTYQDSEGQLSCEPCPSNDGQGVAGAQNVSECGGKFDWIVKVAVRSQKSRLDRGEEESCEAAQYWWLSDLRKAFAWMSQPRNPCVSVQEI